MRRPYIRTRLLASPCFQRLIVALVVAAAGLGCTATTVAPRLVRLAGEDIKSPFQQEEERDSQGEKEEVYTASRQRQRSHVERDERLESASPFTSGGHHHRNCVFGCSAGHCFANGLRAPMIC